MLWSSIDSGFLRCGYVVFYYKFTLGWSRMDFCVLPQGVLPRVWAVYCIIPFIYCFEGVTNEFGLLILYFKSKPVSLSAVKILNPNQLFHACFMYYHLLLPGSCFSLSFIQLSQTYLSCHCISPALYLQIIFWLFELVDHDIFVMLHVHCRAVSFWFSLFSKSVILYVHWRSLCMLKD